MQSVESVEHSNFLFFKNISFNGYYLVPFKIKKGKVKNNYQCMTALKNDECLEIFEVKED